MAANGKYADLDKIIHDGADWLLSTIWNRSKSIGHGILHVLVAGAGLFLLKEKVKEEAGYEDIRNTLKEYGIDKKTVKELSDKFAQIPEQEYPIQFRYDPKSKAYAIITQSDKNDISSSGKWDSHPNDPDTTIQRGVGVHLTSVKQAQRIFDPKLG